MNREVFTWAYDTMESVIDAISNRMSVKHYLMLFSCQHCPYLYYYYYHSYDKSIIIVTVTSIALIAVVS